MKKGINTLIKLHKRQLDELRRKMGSLENQKSQLQLLSAKIQEQLEQEIALAGKSPDMARFFGDFAKRIRKRQEDIAHEIRSLDQQMAKLAVEISAAFNEMKKFEIVKENTIKREKAEERRKETIVMDEVAGQQHQRKQREET